MFTVIWHYEGPGVGCFREASYSSYSIAVHALHRTTGNLPNGQPAPVSGIIVDDLHNVLDFRTGIADGDLIER